MSQSSDKKFCAVVISDLNLQRRDLSVASFLTLVSYE